MLPIKQGSIGEIPPSTRRSPGRSAATARAAVFTMSPKIRHSGSIWKSQCERLFGSFQNITASINRRPPSTDVDFLLGMGGDLEAGAAQHGFGRRAIRYPPVGLVARIAVLDEEHLREVRPVEDPGLGKRIVLLDGRR